MSLLLLRKEWIALQLNAGAEFPTGQGENQLAEYRFNKKQIAHLFCRTCGVQPFGYGATPDVARGAAINVRRLDGVDINALTPARIDGRSL